MLKDDFEYRYTVIFPEAKAYSVDDILSFISAVEHRLDANEWNDDARNEFKAELIERLLKSVVEGKFELWNMSLNKVVAPPNNKSSSSTNVLPDSLKPSLVKAFWKFLSKTFSRPQELNFIQALKNPASVPSSRRSRQDYKTEFWWARMTFIYRSDLISFCKSQRIRATFECEEKQTDEQPGGQATTVRPETENSTGSTKGTAPPDDVQTEQKTNDVLPDEKCLSDELKGKSSQAGNTQLDNSNASANEKPLSKRKENRLKEIQESIENFPNSPDSSFVEVEVVAGLFKCSVPTIWRRVREGQLVEPHHPGTRTTRWQVGEIRQALKEALADKKSRKADT